MKVIAINNGPLYLNYDGSMERRGLLKGKEYDVISWSYQKDGSWTTGIGPFLNRKKAEFFIKVINEDGVEADYWNDYFLSSEEVRDLKINLLIS
jgi:hypothetical protein